ncbi:MAG: hypothetical protein IKQ64_00560 [Bacteroidales bacterium]|nr:hypothetical protein [Bacteroidales bacterium]
MVTITTSEAIDLVRKNLEELDTNSSQMFGDENYDNTALDAIIARTLPEAINAVHLAAPVALLEGKAATLASGTSVSQDGELSFSLASGSKYIRLVAFRAADSGIVVTDTIAEASPEGRKQLNKYVRGRYDRPRLVLLQGRHTEPAFKYYTLARPTSYTSNPASAISLFTYIEEQIYSASATGYDVSRRLRQNAIDCLTAMVMETYSDQRAQSYYQKANIFPTI